MARIASGRWHVGPLAAMVLGALVGFAVGAGLYLAITPVLEGASGWVRELQGLSWNLVPGLTVVGAVLGALVGARRGQPPRA